jgi:methionyl-tRNA formyltransferase
MVGPDVRPLRIVLIGDGRWAAASLAALDAAGHHVTGVVLRHRPSDDSLSQAARRLDVPFRQPARVNTPDVLEWLQQARPDLLLSIACDQILRAPIRAVAPLGALNFHAGKLPFYRGRNVVNWAIINGEEEIGVTAHFMDDGIDTGDIVLQRTLPIGWTDTYGTVLARVVDAMPSLVVDAVGLIATGRAEPRPQRHLQGTYFGGRGPGDEWIDWSSRSSDLHNFIRAITRPGPGARTVFDGEDVVIWRAHFDRSWPSYIAIPGQVVGRSDAGVTIKTGDSTLLLQEVQIAGRTAGAPDWPIGTRLGASRQPVGAERFS